MNFFFFAPYILVLFCFRFCHPAHILWTPVSVACFHFRKCEEAQRFTDASPGVPSADPQTSRGRTQVCNGWKASRTKNTPDSRSDLDNVLGVMLLTFIKRRITTLSTPPPPAPAPTSSADGQRREVVFTILSLQNTERGAGCIFGKQELNTLRWGVRPGKVDDFILFI